jgi:hypothetical protein
MNNTSVAAERSVIQRIISRSLPQVSIQVSPELGYLGQFSMDVNRQAQAEQYYFAQICRGRLGKTFIIHFEHFYPDNQHWFDYPRLRMVQMGGFDFLHQTWPLAHFELFDLPEVKSFFDGLGIQTEPGWLVNRYVTVVGEAKKHELILFYLEPGSQAAVPLEDLQPDGKARADWPEIEQGLIERANVVFQLVNG